MYIYKFIVGWNMFYSVMRLRLQKQAFQSYFCSFAGGYSKNCHNSVQLNIPQPQIFSTWLFRVLFQMCRTCVNSFALMCPGYQCHPHSVRSHRP